LEQLNHAATVADASFDKAKTRISAVLGEVCQPPDRQIIDRQDAAPLSQQRVDKVAADKTGAARNDIELRHDPLDGHGQTTEFRG